MPWTPYDVNGYYRELGFSYGHRPSRRELREAYQRHGGPDDTRLTSIFKLLLDAAGREEYDSQPLGGLYFDGLTSELLNRLALDAAARRGVRQDDVLDAMGLYSPPDKEFAEAPAPPPFRPSPTPARVIWPWSYYSDRSFCADIDRLAAWQSMLIRHLRVWRFAVGFIGVGQPIRVDKNKDHWVILLRDDVEPTEELAATVQKLVHPDVWYASPAQVNTQGER